MCCRGGRAAGKRWISSAVDPRRGRSRDVRQGLCFRGELSMGGRRRAHPSALPSNLHSGFATSAPNRVASSHARGAAGRLQPFGSAASQAGISLWALEVEAPPSASCLAGTFTPGRAVRRSGHSAGKALCSKCDNIFEADSTDAAKLMDATIASAIGDYSTVWWIPGYGWIKASQQAWFKQTSLSQQAM